MKRRPTRRVGRPPSADRAAARRAIVEAAAHRFAEDGYRATPTAAIARDAGVSEGTLFHHFPTKRALLSEVGALEGERVLQIASAALDPAAPPPPTRSWLQPLFTYARQAPAAYRLFAMNEAVEDEAAGYGAKQAHLTRGIAGLLAGWSARGHLRQMDPELVAVLVFAVVDAAVRRFVLEERWEEEDAFLSETCRAIDGILAPNVEPHP